MTKQNLNSTPEETRLTPEDALIIVDVQNDFMPGWSLPVPEGESIVPVINRWIATTLHSGALVVASRDWHPVNHVSFKENGGQWPAHCVKNTRGAGFHPGLNLPEKVMLVSKGDRSELDQYSAFDFTSLAGDLRTQGVLRVFVCGLAQDVCVKATAIDALKNGFETHVIASAMKPLSLSSGQLAVEEMRKAGVIIEE